MFSGFDFLPKKKMFYWAAPLILMVLLSSTAQARFEFITQPDGQRVVKTFAKRGEGLASIVRDLGLKPNWQDQSWLTNIQQANPSQIQTGSFQVINPETPFLIPVESVANLQGYDQLLEQFPEPVIDTTVIPEPIAQDPPLEAPVIEVVEPVRKKEDSGTRRFRGDITLGVGANNLFAERSAVVDTSLNSEVSLHASLNLSYAITEIQRIGFSSRQDT